MDKNELWKIYDNNYASEYNDRYLLNPFSKISSDVELSVLKRVINKQTKWLDLGCGTGYFLSQFPNIARAGLDASPEMLKQASAANPDALFFLEGDFRQDNAEWSGKWPLITCMWGAYCYVDSVTEAESVIANMVKWTQTGGTIFLPVVDLEDVRPNNKTAYELATDVFGGRIALTSVTWTWVEDGTGKIHEHLVSPHAEHLIKLMAPYFENIELVRYPPYMDGWVSRKAILATGKHNLNEGNKLAVITRSAIPDPIIKQKPVNTTTQQTHTPISNQEIFRELFIRMRTKAFYKKFANFLMYKYFK